MYSIFSPAVPAYPKSSVKRDYGHREQLITPRSRASLDYSRVPSERRPSYTRDDYVPRGSAYHDMPRGGHSQSTARRAYADDGYSQRYERPPPPYRETRARDYDSISGSKRPYSAMVSLKHLRLCSYIKSSFLIM